MNEIEYERIIKDLFAPNLLVHKFELMGKSISGRAYSYHFLHPLCKINLTYELGDKYFDIFVYTVDFNPLKDLDDPSKNPRLGSLRRRYKKYLHSNLKSAENSNRTTSDRNLIKAAKDFEIILPLLMRDLDREFLGS